MKTLRIPMLFIPAFTLLMDIGPVTLFGFPHDSLTEQYLTKARKAHDLLDDQHYLKAARLYREAFDGRDRVGIYRRFRSACAWAKAGKTDSAFRQLLILVKERNYTDINHLLISPYLTPLKKDPRYARVMQLARENRLQKLGKHDTALLAQLDTIDRRDAKFRIKHDLILRKYGRQSDTFQAIWEKQAHLDSLNQVRVEKILKANGWPSPAEVGKEACEAIFMVLQHADRNVGWQKQYLPQVRRAAKAGKIDSADMAMFIDRVRLNTGRKQLYGTQIGYHEASDQHYVKPLKDPLTLEKRRGPIKHLPPMDLYLSNWDLEWDAKAYKQNLPQYIEWDSRED